jgi:hypothetical protein
LLACVLSVQSALAQEKPLPSVPLDLPAASREILNKVRASLVTRGTTYDAKGPAFLARCGEGKIPAGDNAKMTSCLGEQAALAREIADIQIDEKNFTARVEPSADPSVVDARGQMNGVYLTNQVAELRNSPEVGQINKGFDAVVNHQWDVALAWWKQALFRDPNNDALKRSVDLAQWMVDRKSAHKAGLVSPLNAAMHTASTGDWAAAIRQFEAAKVENPAIAPLANHMIAALRDKQVTAAYWDREITRSTKRFVSDLRTDALMMQVHGMDAEARKSWELADFYSMGLP